MVDVGGKGVTTGFVTVDRTRAAAGLILGAATAGHSLLFWLPEINLVDGAALIFSAGVPARLPVPRPDPVHLTPPLDCME